MKRNGYKLKGKVGRPTKYVPEIIEKVLNAVAVGAPFTHACNYAGINFDTFNEWRKTYPEFSEQLKEAEGRAAVGWLDKIETAAKEGNWQAAAWKLERRYPHDFGRRDRMPVDVSELDAEIEQRLEGMASRSEDTVTGSTENDSIH